MIICTDTNSRGKRNLIMTSKIKPTYIWIVTIVFIVLGILPYKLPAFDTEINEKNKLLVYHEECTCCGDMYIEKGEVEVLEPYKKFFPDKIYELTFTKNESLSKIQYDLLVGNKFIIKGQIVGVDSSEGNTQSGDCQIRPIYEITDWKPTTYSPLFSGFNPIIIILYFVISFSLIIFSIIVTANYKRKA